MSVINVKRMKEQMNNEKLDNKTLGDKVGCSGAFIGQILNGFKNPGIEILFRIAAVLNCSADDLVKKESDT